MEETAVNKFIKAHGGNPVQAAPDSAEYLLPDGARFSGIEWITMNDPPMDPTLNLRARVRYWQTAVANDVAGFNRQKAEFDQQDYYHLQAPSMCPPSPPFAAEHLRNWQARIEGFRATLNELTEELNETRQVQDDRAGEEARRIAAQQVRDRMNERATITVGRE